jgi:hypothetical protein
MAKEATSPGCPLGGRIERSAKREWPVAGITGKSDKLGRRSQEVLRHADGRRSSGDWHSQTVQDATLSLVMHGYAEMVDFDLPECPVVGPTSPMN